MMAVESATKNARRRFGRSVCAAVLAVLLVPLVPGSPADGSRPEFSAEARAALFTEALDLELARVNLDEPLSRLADRGDRVRKANRVVAFKAGSLVKGRTLLEVGLAAGDDYMRTALAGSAVGEAISRVASAFEGRSIILSDDELTMMAALPSSAAGTSSDAAVGELAYAATGRPSISSRFDGILKDGPTGFIPPLGKKDHAWAATPLPASAYSKKEQTCLATGVYFEARGETQDGQAAVAQVILNRVRAPSYPDTICDVVYQNRSWKNRCQFSFACDGIPDRITNKRAYGIAQTIARDVTQGERWSPEVGSSTHYHATYVKPRWARAMERVDKIGLHVFYRTLNGGWN